MMIFQNKRTRIITLFTNYMTDMISLMSFKIYRELHMII